ncbi:MAG: STAS domain-containing protein [Bacteroidetes bacterium]|nr:STAS domain-containing protein [Bacteroidota bacterium]MBS1973486.1 STAS domain-containing protein [Bacteroidota bacterium]
MKFKIDTREKFHAITINEPALAANMTAELDECLIGIQQNVVKNVVLVMKDIKSMDNAAASYLVKVQQRFYEKDASFVICGLCPEVERFLDEGEFLGLMNTAPTESEAADIVYMEEIERELLRE